MNVFKRAREALARLLCLDVPDCCPHLIDFPEETQP